MLSATYYITSLSLNNIAVSILVLMECSPQLCVLATIVEPTQSFNPCFNGMLSATYEFQACIDALFHVVSILVLMECSPQQGIQGPHQ